MQNGEWKLIATFEKQFLVDQIELFVQLSDEFIKCDEESIFMTLGFYLANEVNPNAEFVEKFCRAFARNGMGFKDVD